MIPEVILIGVVGGLVTGLSPCILPVLPIVLAVSADAKRKPILVALGIALSFTAITLLGTVALSALGLPSGTLRWIGVALLVIVGLSMLVPALGELLERPFAAIRVPTWIYDRTSEDTQPDDSTKRSSGFGIGLALGAVYAPCAGPVLAAVTVAGATGNIGWQTVILAFSFAFGACVPLFFFALAGSAWSKRADFASKHRTGITRVAGALVLALALAIATDVPARLQRTLPDWTASVQEKFNSSDNTQNVLDGIGGDTSNSASSASLKDCRDGDPSVAADCGPVPAFEGLSNWINTDRPVDPAHPGKVGDIQTITLVDFWAYACINCQRANEHITKLYDHYRDYGLNVVGIHAPEYAFEREPANVAAAVEAQKIHYPVALDNEFLTWSNFINRYWPAHYLVDAQGQVRQIHEGEGEYAATERVVRQLLADANPGIDLPAPIEADDTDKPIATQDRNLETYLGTDRAKFYNNPPREYTPGPHNFTFREPFEKGYSLEGPWELREQSIVPTGPGAKIHLNYYAALVQIVASGEGELKVTDDNGKVTTFPAKTLPGTIDLLRSEDGSPLSGNLTIEMPESMTAYSLTFG